MRQRQTELTVLDAQVARGTHSDVYALRPDVYVYVDADADADVQMYRAPFEATINRYVFTRDHTNHSTRPNAHTIT